MSIKLDPREQIGAGFGGLIWWGARLLFARMADSMRPRRTAAGASKFVGSQLIGGNENGF